MQLIYPGGGIPHNRSQQGVELGSLEAREATLGLHATSLARELGKLGLEGGRSEGKWYGDDAKMHVWQVVKR